MAKARDPWARVNSGLPQHRKALALGRMLGGAERAWAIPVALWLWAMRAGFLDGRLEGVTAEEIAAVADWRGDAGELVRALKACRWIEEDASGTYLLHEWELYHEKAIEQLDRDREAARERMRRRRAELAAQRLQEAAGTLAAGRSGDSPGTPGAAHGAGTLAPGLAGTPAAVDSGAEGDEPGREGTCSGERSGERSGELPHARASSRFVSSRFVGGGPGEPGPGSLGGALGEVAELAEFGAWWAAYPPTPRRPSDRAKAWEQWLATRGARPPLASLLRRLEVQLGSAVWLREGGLYVPRAENYLRDRRWAEVEDPGPPPEPERFDAGERLRALAAAVPAPFASWLAPRLEALARDEEREETVGSLGEVEAALATLQDELAAAAEADLTDEEREEVARRVAQGERRAAVSVPPGERAALRERFRRQVIARLRGLPTLSLFAPEAERGAA